MTCTKTGAHIYLVTHGEYAWCDAYEVSNVAYFRIVDTSREPITDVVHYGVQDYSSWFNQHSEGTSTLITNNFINYGYEGMEIEMFKKHIQGSLNG